LIWIGLKKCFNETKNKLIKSIKDKNVSVNKISLPISTSGFHSPTFRNKYEFEEFFQYLE
jgi:hypothetical protein